jgi:hypothetical protein
MAGEVNTNLGELNLDSKHIAKIALDSIAGLSLSQQELLFQTKKEQTFSAILASELQNQLSVSQFRALVELKGLDYVVGATSDRSEKKNRNTHDVGVLDNEANLKLILENKVWYHFDGAKGSKNIRVEKNVEEQLKQDIFKLRHSAKNLDIKNCYILICVVTPSKPETLPKTYRQSHETALKRTEGDLSQYKRDGLSGIRSVIDKFSQDLSSVVHLGSQSPMGISESGFLDVFCAQVIVK